MDSSGRFRTRQPTHHSGCTLPGWAQILQLLWCRDHDTPFPRGQCTNTSKSGVSGGEKAEKTSGDGSVRGRRVGEGPSGLARGAQPCGARGAPQQQGPTQT